MLRTGRDVQDRSRTACTTFLLPTIGSAASDGFVGAVIAVGPRAGTCDFGPGQFLPHWILTVPSELDLSDRDLVLVRDNSEVSARPDGWGPWSDGRVSLSSLEECVRLAGLPTEGYTDQALQDPDRWDPARPRHCALIEDGSGAVSHPLGPARGGPSPASMGATVGADLLHLDHPLEAVAEDVPLEVTDAVTRQTGRGVRRPPAQSRTRTTFRAGARSASCVVPVDDSSGTVCRVCSILAECMFRPAIRVVN